ncbi:MAG: Zinc/iron permease [Benniella sp.]|nr:MAG: Zinc/iron permease [Benniella sp.]
MSVYSGSDDYRAWAFTLASAMACVFGAGLIFIDTIGTKILGREVRMLQNHKFLAGSLGLGSGVMIFSSLYSILPEAKQQLSSDLSIFNNHADAVLMISFFAGVGSMGFIHWIMHRVDSRGHSPGIESSGAIEHFMQREAGQKSQQSLLPQRHSISKTHQAPASPHRDPFKPHTTSGVPTPTRVCNGCMSDNSDDSEYVDDEVTSLLNNAFLQIGRTPNSCMDDGDHMQSDHTRGEGHSHNDDDDDDVDNIEVVVTDQKGRMYRHAVNHNNNDVDMDLDLDQSQVDHTDRRKNSWSSASTRSLKPFAPVNKKRLNKVKGCRHNSNCHLARTAAKGDLGSSHRQLGTNNLPTYGSIPPSVNRYPARHTPSFPHSEPTATRHTSFPRLKGSGTIYSRHDVLDHAVADDREHADLTEIGIQTALTIAIHKFPEGLITFLSTTADPCLGFSVFMAIAVHNLIEGYLIAFPLFIGLHSRSKAFALAAALGGLSQPLGALLGWFILHKVASMGWQVSATGCIYAMVAGMMSSIAVNGMWPQAVKCVGRNPTKVVQYCFFAGIAIMGVCQTVMGTRCDAGRDGAGLPPNSIQ